MGGGSFNSLVYRVLTCSLFSKLFDAYISCFVWENDEIVKYSQDSFSETQVMFWFLIYFSSNCADQQPQQNVQIAQQRLDIFA